MKATVQRFVILSFFVVLAPSVAGQNVFEKFTDWAQISLSKVDGENDEVKKGFTFIPYPNLSYSTDMGWQLGASAELVDFGKQGQYYPGYSHRVFLQFSYFTSNSLMYRLFYDSENLIKNVRTTFEVTILPQPLCDFYGYNGYEAPLNDGMHKNFNKIDRKFGRVTLDFEGKIFKHLKWYAGASYFHYNIESANGSDTDAPPTLYDLYIMNNLINSDEKQGGNHVYVKGGFVFDSRDSEADPTSGVRSELFLAYTPDMIHQGGYSHLKLAFTHATFKPLIEDQLVLATRIGYHGTIGGGEVPFYLQSNINGIYLRRLTSEGLGGVTTLRGVLTNRVVGDAVAWSNIEMRCRLMELSAFGHNMYLSTNPFLDFGAVVQRYRGSQMEAAGESEMGHLLYEQQPERLHFSAGLGLKLVIDKNIVFSGEIGKAFNAQDGNDWQMAFGSNFIF